MSPDDIYNVREVRDPQRSPDGKWVAYTVTRPSRDTDKDDTDVWMVSWDGAEQIQVTSSPEGESTPRWSPDGRYLAFVSSRQGAKRGAGVAAQPAGGEAIKLTDVKGGVSDYAWSPTAAAGARGEGSGSAGSRAEKEPEKRPDDTTKTPKPIVIDRYNFKADVDGYLRGERSHLLPVRCLESKKARSADSGQLRRGLAGWSPDGKRIAFMRRHGDGDVESAEPRRLRDRGAPGAKPRAAPTSTTAEERRGRRGAPTASRSPTCSATS